jgi:hypothetical protein
MARGSLRRVTTLTTTATAVWELIGSTTGPRTRLMELHIFLTAATASLFALGRPAAKGVTPTSPVAIQPDDPIEALNATVAVAWGTGPTVPAQFLRSVQLPGAIGAGIIWTFGPNGIAIPATGVNTLIVWTLSAVGANTEIICVVEE